MRARFAIAIGGVPLVLGALPSCAPDPLPPEGEIVVYVDTDAPLVTSVNPKSDLSERSGLFDTLLAEVIDAAGAPACDACTRQFSVTQDELEVAPFSFGVRLPPGTTGYRLRLRLFPHEARIGDAAREDATIDALIALPIEPAEGRVEASVVLRFDSVGAPADLASGGDAAVIGRQPRVAPVVPRTRPTCSRAPAPGEVCVPGGVYWASHAYRELAVGDWRAIVVRPFFVDAAEVTVASLRASGVATSQDPERRDGCTYRDAPDDHDSLPVTCISLARARDYCRSRSADLPTLSQLEYLRSGLEQHVFVWGDEPPSCDDAVWGRNPDSGLAGPCALLGPGAQPAGKGRRDRLTLAGGVVVDLAGNVGELLADRSNAACTVRGLYFDPVCGAPGGITGGSFANSSRDALTAPSRRSQEEAPLPDVGFRCARPSD